LSGLTTSASFRESIGPASRVGVEQFLCFPHQGRICGLDAQAPALVIAPRVVEAVNVEDTAIDDHHFAVIAHQIAGRA
jgi:hypothetical protein